MLMTETFASAVAVIVPIFALAAGAEARGIRERLRQPDPQWEREFAAYSAEHDLDMTQGPGEIVAYLKGVPIMSTLYKVERGVAIGGAIVWLVVFLMLGITELNCLIWLADGAVGGNPGLAQFSVVSIEHRDVEIGEAAGSFYGDDHRFRVGAAREAFFIHVNFRRIDLETKTLVVEKRDGIADDHVGEFADRFANDLVAFLNFASREMAGHFHGDFRRKIENDAAFDIALDGDKSGDAFAAIGVLVHGKVENFGRRLNKFGKDGVGGVNKGLDEFHSHARFSPAKATGAPTALGSSLRT